MKYSDLQKEEKMKKTEHPNYRNWDQAFDYLKIAILSS